MRREGRVLLIEKVGVIVARGRSEGARVKDVFSTYGGVEE